MPADLVFNPTVRQAIALRKLDSPRDSELLYGGAKGGGKSYFGCRWMFIRCKQIIAHCRIIEKPAFPILVGFMGRKRGSDFASTTLETWKQTIPADLYEIKGKPAEIIIDDRVKILTGGLDNIEVINKFNSAELHCVFIDQAEEIEKDDISVLRGSLRQKINGRHLPYKILWTANPKQCWLKTDFVDNPTERYQYVPALPTDNPHLPDGYIDTLIAAFKHRPELLKGYLEGDWSSFTGANQVISPEWLDDAAKRVRLRDPFKEYLVCDPARFGDDETVIMHFKDMDVHNKIVLPHCRTTELSSRLARESIQAGRIPVVVESVGSDVGAGVIDELVGMGVHVIQFNPAEAADKVNGARVYYNRRAEAWWYAAKVLSSGVIDEKNQIAITTKLDQTTREQLTQPTYEFRGQVLLVEEKAAIKKRLGRSPDHGDCYVIGLWAYNRVPARTELFIQKSTSARVPSYVALGVG